MEILSCIRQHLRLVFVAHHAAIVLEAINLVEVGGAGNTPKLGAETLQFGAAQLNLGAVAEAVVEIAGTGGEHAGVVFHLGLVAHAEGEARHLDAAAGSHAAIGP